MSGTDDKFLSYLNEQVIREPILDYAQRKGFEIEQIETSNFDYQLKSDPKVKINSNKNEFRDFSLSEKAQNSKGNIANFAVNRNLYPMYRQAIVGISKEITQSTPILDYARGSGHEVGRLSPKEYFLRDNPSLKINSDKNLFYDFGTPIENSQFYGDCLEFIKYTEGLDDKRAYEQLMDYRLNVDSTVRQQKISKVHNTKKPFKFNPKILNDRGNKTPRLYAKQYLTEQRGLDKEVVDKLMSVKVGDPANDVRLVDQTKDERLIFNWEKPFSRTHTDTDILGGTTQELRPNSDGKHLKRILSNSESEYGFNFFLGKDKGEKPKGIVFCESAIDCFSVFESMNQAEKLYPKMQPEKAKIHNQQSTDYYHFQSTEGVKPSIFENTIKQYMNQFNEKPEKVVLCFDNDNDGRIMAKKCMESDIVKKNKIETVLGIPKGYPNSKDPQKKVDWNDKLNDRKQALGLTKNLTQDITENLSMRKAKTIGR